MYSFHRSLFLLITILFSSTVFAAYPESFEGRRRAVKILRKDFAIPNSTFKGKGRDKEWRWACSVTTSPYSGCNPEKWTVNQRPDIKAANAYFAPRCKRGLGEPLSCLVTGWYNGFINGKPSKKAINPKKAFQELTKACKKKAYAPACSYLGDMWAEGVGTRANAKKARDLYEEGCKAKSEYGCYRLGTLSFQGRAMKQSVAKSKDYFSAGCKAGLSQACVDEGLLYVRGIGVRTDYERAMSLFDKSCAGQNGEGCYFLADMHVKNQGRKARPEIAFGLFSKNCREGDQRSCFGLGLLHQRGIVIDKNIQEATRLFGQACNAKYAPACSHYGLLKMNKKSKLSDPRGGIDLLRKGCDGGDARGCVSFARLLEVGNELLKANPNKALKLYTKSCTGRQGPGCHAMGRIYDEGKLVAKDHKKAKKFYEMGCNDLMDGESCGALGERYYEGQFKMLKNHREALRYLSRGCNLGHNKSCASLGDFYALGKLVKKDPKRALSLYETACAIEDYVACYKAGKLIVDDKVKNVKVSRALHSLNAACKSGDEKIMEKACQASKPIYFKGKFEEIVAKAFESNKCEIWTSHDNPNRNKMVISADRNRFQVLLGQYKGQTFTAKLDRTRYKTLDRKKVAQSLWNLQGDKDQLQVEHHENWHFIRNPDPDKSFPGPESYSADRVGGKSIYYQREKERMARNINKMCTFVKKVKWLQSEHCTEVQALIGAQLTSKCKK